MENTRKCHAFLVKEMVRFPDPIGLKPTYYSLHSEPLTLGKYIKGVKVVDIKVIFPDEEIEKLSPLIEFGLTSQDRSRTAMDLGVDRATLYRSLKKGNPYKKQKSELIKALQGHD